MFLLVEGLKEDKTNVDQVLLGQLGLVLTQVEPEPKDCLLFSDIPYEQLSLEQLVDQLVDEGWVLVASHDHPAVGSQDVL